MEIWCPLPTPEEIRAKLCLKPLGFSWGRDFVCNLAKNHDGPCAPSEAEQAADIKYADDKFWRIAFLRALTGTAGQGGALFYEGIVRSAEAIADAAVKAARKSGRL